MKKYIIITSLLIVSVFFFSCSTSKRAVKKRNVKKTHTVQKAVALTFDDLPFASNNEFLKDEEKKKLFMQFLDVLKKYNVKVTGFVIGNRYDSSWYPYFKRFIEEGHTLGNHTFSHYNSNDHSSEDYINNVARCDSLLENVMTQIKREITGNPNAEIVAKRTSKAIRKKLLYPSPTLKDKEKINEILTADRENLEAFEESPYNFNFRYFRYPYLNRGDSENKKRTIMSALESMGYQIAPVTITSNDWRFNPRYETAYLNGDAHEMAELKKLYLNRIKRELYNSEDYSLVTFHRHVKHIMLFHLNVINTLELESILKLLKNFNYKIIGIDEALTDELYEMVDNYSGSYGVPWLYRAKRVRTIKE